MRNLYTNTILVAFICLVSARTRAEPSPENLEQRVMILEEKVHSLENAPTAEHKCLTHIDGVVPKGTANLVKDKNMWKFGEITYGTYAIQVLQYFKTETGLEAVSLRISAPNRSPSCSIGIYAKKDVLLN